MQPPVEAKISELSAGFSINYIIVNVDRIFVRESVKLLEDPERVVKEYGSLDMLCWDMQGARMVCSLANLAAVDAYGETLKPKKTYMFSRYLVAEPGFGVHDRFHIRLDEHSTVNLMSEPFVDRVFNLCSPNEIPRSPTSLGSIYDVCGFLLYAYEVVFNRHEEYVEKECVVLLGSCLEGSISEIRAAVVIHMFGTWVEYESYKLRKMMNKRQGNPFILIKHVRAEMREDTGNIILHSVLDATKVVTDIHIPEVIQKRAQLVSK